MYFKVIKSILKMLLNQKLINKKHPLPLYQFVLVIIYHYLKTGQEATCNYGLKRRSGNLRMSKLAGGAGAGKLLDHTSWHPIVHVHHLKNISKYFL